MVKQEKAFKELKERFTKELVLVVPYLYQKRRMEVDASDYAIEGVLSMECKNKQWRLVAYISKSLNKIKKNYEIHDKVVIRRSEN